MDHEDEDEEDEELHNDRELRYLIVINKAIRYLMLDRTRIGAIRRAVINYELMYPNASVSKIHIQVIDKDLVLGFRELIQL